MGVRGPSPQWIVLDEAMDYDDEEYLHMTNVPANRLVSGVTLTTSTAGMGGTGHIVAGGGGVGGAGGGAVPRQPRVRGYRFVTGLGFDCGLQFNDTFRLGAVKVDVTGLGYDAQTGAICEQVEMTCSTATWSHLQAEERRGGTTPTLDLLEGEIHLLTGQGAAVKTKMVDLSMKGPRKVVDRRTTTRPSNDRVEFVTRGISDLVSQMATLMGMPEHTRSDNQVAQIAKRYAELAGEMEKLRRSLTEAEGHFEIAQQQVIALMGGTE